MTGNTPNTTGAKPVPTRTAVDVLGHEPSNRHERRKAAKLLQQERKKNG